MASMNRRKFIKNTSLVVASSVTHFNMEDAALTYAGEATNKLPKWRGFNFHWNMWAKRYKNVSSKKISFDLLNEPSMREDMNDQHSKSGQVPGDVYRQVAKAAAESIRKENKNHIVIADGNNVGNEPIP